MAKQTLYQREAKPESFAKIFSKNKTEFNEKSKKTIIIYNIITIIILFLQHKEYPGLVVWHIRGQITRF